ncbi:12955_t:CDS:1, partial [Acaulospora colombiana]
QEKSVVETAVKNESVEATSLLKVEPDGDVVMTPQVESGIGAMAEDEVTPEVTDMVPTPYETNIESSPPINNFPIPLNLNSVAKNFKNPHYRPSRKYKNVKQMLVAERKENMPLDIPTCKYPNFMIHSLTPRVKF